MWKLTQVSGKLAQLPQKHDEWKANSLLRSELGSRTDGCSVKENFTQQNFTSTSKKLTKERSLARSNSQQQRCMFSSLTVSAAAYLRSLCFVTKEPSGIQCVLKMAKKRKRQRADTARRTQVCVCLYHVPQNYHKTARYYDLLTHRSPSHCTITTRSVCLDLTVSTAPTHAHLNADPGSGSCFTMEVHAYGGSSAYSITKFWYEYQLQKSKLSDN